ncbi:MAG: tetratricopeptide repeat protein [Burkholderiales bacterium]|nr:MAG: tetratricopeptide repeat protein [Burkholderiales bacterium]
MSPGDLIIQNKGNGWSAIKILAIDPWADGSSTAHCLAFATVKEKPTVASLRLADIMLLHAPIDAGSFREGWEKIGNQPPTTDDLVGFVQYLKSTDFARYVTFTGQDSREIVRKVDEHYQRANALSNQGKRLEAIQEYSLSIDLFPLFFEAIDNRAFTYMELSMFREALNDFEQSLEVNPVGVTAFFSKGECLMKLGELKAAETVFQEGLNRFPEKQAQFANFLNQVRTLQ